MEEQKINENSIEVLFQAKNPEQKEKESNSIIPPIPVNIIINQEENVVISNKKEMNEATIVKNEQNDLNEEKADNTQSIVMNNSIDSKCEVCSSVDKSKLLTCNICRKYKCKECVSKESLASSSNKKINPSIYVCKNCLNDQNASKIRVKSSALLSNKRYRENNSEEANDLLDLDKIRNNFVNSTDKKLPIKKRAYTRRNIKPAQSIQTTQLPQSRETPDPKKTNLKELQLSYVNKVESNCYNGTAKCGMCRENKQRPYVFKTYYDILFYAKHLYETQETSANSKNKFYDFFNMQSPLTSANKDFTLDNILCKDCLNTQLHNGFPILITIDLLFNQNKTDHVENSQNKPVQLSIEEIKKVFFLAHFFCYMQKNFIKKIYDVIKQFVEKMTNNQVSVEYILKKILDNSSNDKNNLDNYRSLQNMNSSAIMLIQELNDTINQLQINGDLLDSKPNSIIPNALANVMDQSNLLLQYQNSQNIEGPGLDIPQLNAMNFSNIDNNAMAQLINQLKTPNAGIGGMTGLNSNIANTAKQMHQPQLQMPQGQLQIPQPQIQIPQPQYQMTQTTQPPSSSSNLNNLFMGGMPNVWNNIKPNQMMTNPIQPKQSNQNPSITESNSFLQMINQNNTNNIYYNPLISKLFTQNQPLPAIPNFPSNQQMQNNSNINLNFMHPINQINAIQGFDPNLLTNCAPQTFPGMINQFCPQSTSQPNQNDNYLNTLSNIMNLGGGMDQPPINKK